MAADFRVPTGHVFRVERTRGPAWYAKYQLPDGRQV
jgi:integrase